MKTHSDHSDTSSEALAVQLECLRQMTPRERMRRACAWSGEIRRMAVSMTFDAIRRRHPEYSEEEVRLNRVEPAYVSSVLALKVSSTAPADVSRYTRKDVWEACRSTRLLTLRKGAPLIQALTANVLHQCQSHRASYTSVQPTCPLLISNRPAANQVLASTARKFGIEICGEPVTWISLIDKSRPDAPPTHFLNTHVVHSVEFWRFESSRLLMRKIQEIGNGRRAVLTGDYIAAADSESSTALFRMVNYSST